MEIIILILLISLIVGIFSWRKRKARNIKFVEELKYFEYKKECKRCSFIWNTSQAEEFILELQQQGINLKRQLGGTKAATYIQRNPEEAKEKLQILRKCPKCKSTDYYESSTKKEGQY